MKAGPKVCTRMTSMAVPGYSYGSQFNTPASFQNGIPSSPGNDGEYQLDCWTRVCPASPPRAETSLGYIGSCIDITDIRRAQEEAVARARVESLRVLAGGIAHDFTNLMSTILANAEVAEIGMGGGASPEIETIKAAADQAVDIARELMIYAGQDKGTMEPLDLSQLVEAMMEILKTSVPKRCVLKVDLQKKLPVIWGNATHIRQVLMNLIINAAEAIGDGEGTVQIRTSVLPAGKEPRGVPGTTYLSLEVTDTGMGMTESEESRIFDPFFTTKEKGHGLGLAVVHGIVHSHGGFIDVASEPGRGTTFDIHFPCAEFMRAGLPRAMARHLLPETVSPSRKNLDLFFARGNHARAQRRDQWLSGFSFVWPRSC